MTFDSLYGRLPGDTSATEPMWPSLTDRDLVGSRSHGEGIPDRHHEGWHGHTISQVHDSAQKVLAADGEAAIPHPNVVMLLAGLTDIVHDEDVPTAPDRLSSLIDHIYTAAPDVAIVVGTLPPSDDTAIQARIDAYNDGVRSMVNDRIGEGDHLVLVDLSAVTTDDLVDGVHPGDQGYEKIADAFMAGIHWALVNGWIKDPPVPVTSPTHAPTASSPAWAAPPTLVTRAMTPARPSRTMPPPRATMPRTGCAMC